MQSVFHPAYRRLHQEANLLLGQKSALTYKGEGGEAELKPHATTTCDFLRDGVNHTIEWPRMLPERVKPVELENPALLLDTWQGTADDDYGVTAVVQTAAVALLLTGRASTIQRGQEQAHQLWQNRDREALPCR